MTITAEKLAPAADAAAVVAAAATARCSDDQMLGMLQDYDCWVFDLDGEQMHHSRGEGCQPVTHAFESDAGTQ